MSAGWAALAGAANAYTQQRQSDQEEQRWEQRYAIMQRQQQAAEQARARYLEALNPPKVQTINTTNDKGEQVTRQQQWNAPSDEDIAAGRAGSWATVGETPNITFERLAETQKNNEERNKLAAERNQALSEAAAGRLDVARERLAAQQERGGAKNNGTISFEDYEKSPPERRAMYDRFRRGESDPNEARDMAARKQTLEDLSTVGKPTDSMRANTLYRNQVGMGADPFRSVKAGSETGAPMGQFDSAPQQAAAAPAKKSPYPDGTVLNGPDGRKYIVRNGKPVPL
jgi:hypothetical protein